MSTKGDPTLTRRGLLIGLTSLGLSGCVVAPRGRRVRGRRGRRRRRVRRRVRRRIRRRALWRPVRGRRLLVVPVAAAVGWELAYDNRVVVVHEVRSPEVIVVRYPDSSLHEVAYTREDSAENGQELEGSALHESDTSAPFVEREEEVEVEEDAP